LQGNDAPLEDDAVVNLVGDDVKVMFPTQVDDVLDVPFRHDGTGGLLGVIRTSAFVLSVIFALMSSMSHAQLSSSIELKTTGVPSKYLVCEVYGE
jgi:hypothetical protein